MFLRFKDIFTIGTIVCGFLTLVLASIGNILLASLMILLGFLLDSFDGFYSRLTKTGNKFGAEFDRIADLIIYSMAPGILLFFVYKDYNIFLAALVGVLPLIFGSIRLARFNLKRIEYPGYWIGLPRPASALLIVGFVNSSIFLNFNLMVFGLFFVLILSIANVSLIPYIGHHKRTFSNLQKAALFTMVILFSVSMLFNFFWDYLFLLSLVYLISPWTLVPKKDRKKIKIFIEKWGK